MASFNRVVLVGNLTRDIELRYTPGGTPVTDMGLAVNERVKRNDEWTDEVNFFDVTLWSRTAEIAAEYLSKGSSVLIEGRLKYDTWEQDGQKRSKIKIVGERMQMLGSRGGGGGGAPSGSGTPHSKPAQQQANASSSADQQNNAVSSPPDDEVPF